MIWILSFITISSISASDSYKNFSVQESYDILSMDSVHVHATTHVTNIIRNGNDNLFYTEVKILEDLGLSIQNGKVIANTPNDLNQIFETEHFRFHYAIEGYDAVLNVDYILQMANVFENVYLFYIDTLGFSPPIKDPISDDDLYEVFIENLPSYFFGITYTKNSSVASPSCVSYIKMRNNYIGSQFSDKTELENIQVTAVHEFFHAIQFSYNCYEKFWFMEATAVWSEDELYDNVNDHYRYISSWFSNTDKPLNQEGNHMYGSFIFFQYIDEHFGGPNTIKLCWDKSIEFASPIQDNSIKSINAALNDLGSSFDEVYQKMRIANKIMNSNAGIYSYEEADGYISAGANIDGINIFYQKGEVQQKSYFNLDLFQTNYYQVHTSNPIEVEIIPHNENVPMLSITKLQDKNQWSIRSGNKINIDTEMGIEWITFLVSALGSEEQNWDYTIEFKDGFSEDFTMSNPFPNPSFGKPVLFSIETVSKQKIATSIYNVLGQKVWAPKKGYLDSEINDFVWNGVNNEGKKVSSGLYFIEAVGEKKKFIHKIVFFKDE